MPMLTPLQDAADLKTKMLALVNRVKRSSDGLDAGLRVPEIALDKSYAALCEWISSAEIAALRSEPYDDPTWDTEQGT